MSAEQASHIRAVFAGTPQFAVPSLLRLARHPRVTVVAVYTQPDRGSGRGRRATPGAIKETASGLSIPVRQPPNLTGDGEYEAFAELQADLLVVAAYGLLIPKAFLELPRLAVNVHASCLPRWRGAAPIQRAIMAGDATTGISMMRVVEALDAGPVLLQRSCAIEATDTGGTLQDKLAHIGADCLEVVIDDLLAGRGREIPQDESQVTYAKKITAADRILDWQRSAVSLERQVRALNPAPVAQMRIDAVTVKVWQAAVLDSGPPGAPGELVAYSEHGIDVRTSDGILRITELQPEGKRPMNAAAFVNGFRALLEKF